MPTAVENLARRAQKIDLAPLSEMETPFRICVISDGAVTPHGLNADDTWESMKAGKNAITTLTYDPFSFPVKNAEGKIIRDSQIMASTAGTIKGFDAEKMLVDQWILPYEEVMEMQGSFIHYALASSFEALSKVVASNGEPLLVHRMNRWGKRDEDRGWIVNRNLVHPSRIKVKVGCGYGGDTSPEVMDLLRNGDIPDSSHMMKKLEDRAPSAITQAFGIWGGEAAETAACASSGAALLDAIRAIRLGEVDIALVVGTEGVLDLPVAMAEFDAMGALDKGKDPNKVSRSLHKIRRGFTIAEGAVALLLTSEAWRRRNGIKNLYNIIGYAEESGAGDNTNPNPIAQERAMRMARRRAELLAPMDGRIVIVQHGTGTGKGEESEVLATKRAFQDKRKDVYITAPKRTTGHMLGAAGNLSQFVAGRCLQEGVVIGTPVIEGEELMDELNGWKVPTETIQVKDLKKANVNQFGFGDINAAVESEVADAA